MYHLFACVWALCLISSSLNALQEASHEEVLKPVDLAWQASEQRWLRNLYCDLGPNIDEHIRNARPIFDVDSFTKISPHSGGTIEHLNKLIESNNIDEFAYTCYRFWKKGHSANLSAFDGTDLRREPLTKAIMLQREECVSLLLAFGVSSKYQTIISSAEETITNIPKVLRATKSANIITTALLLQYGASPYARKMSIQPIMEKDEESGYFDRYGVFHRDPGESFDCYEIHRYYESCLHVALESNAPCSMLELLLRYSVLPEAIQWNKRNVVYGKPYPTEATFDTEYENNSLITKAFTCKTTGPLKTLLHWGANPNARYNSDKAYLLDLVEPIIRSSAPEHEHNARIKAIYKVLLRYGARKCKTASALRDIALDELIEKYEIKLGIKGEACTICLPFCGRYASSEAPYTLCTKHRKKRNINNTF